MDKKGIIAIGLCGIGLVAYFLLMPKFAPQKPQKDIQNERYEQDVFKGFDSNEGDTSSYSSSSDTSKEDSSMSSSVDEVVKKLEPEQTGSTVELQDYIVIQNENIIAVWTNEGAALKTVTLKKYKNKEMTNNMELIKSSAGAPLPLIISKLKIGQFENSIETSLANHRFRVIANTKDKISFETTLKSGLQIIKNVSLAPNEYHLNMEFVFRNKSDQNLNYAYQLVAASGIVYEGQPQLDMMSVVGINKGNGKYKLIKTNLKDLPEGNESMGIAWVGNVNKYFATILAPRSSKWINTVNSRATVGTEEEIEDFMTTLQTKSIAIPAQDEIKHDYIFFLGPKIDTLLVKYNLQSLLGFGVFAPISKLLLKVLNGAYSMIPNYGVAILLMTLLVKLLLFPLSRKSQTSMFKMQALQPQIEDLKKKYKTDKQKMAKAQMELFKKNGANPLGGCLPMVFQMPVFFALFRTLQSAFEMRQAPFALWISDLSMPDTLITLPFTIPLLGNMLNILPLIMTGASFMQMRLNPKTPSIDPQARMQQKMMSFMPLMFCFILYKMPSGLTLYWTTSTILGICENLYIRYSLKNLKLKKKT